ncbi:hypothetical protein RB653_008010 [Dictyostelium firmibasis]|uniref:N-acetyltransferase domain-containing protein n=1 Tax=Dictyostelium firmibasis TaxID=79012 RepID=A0AAN7U466_9MYCE
MNANTKENNSIEFKLIKSIEGDFKKQLIELLINGVKDGDLGFSHPLSEQDAEKYWEKIDGDLKQTKECRFLLIGISNDNNRIAGTVQLSWDTTYNNSFHRAEVQKLMVNTEFRGIGMSKRLMSSIESHAMSIKKKMLILDTRSDHPISPSLYKSIGYTEFGSVPFFSLDSDGYSSTTYFYKILDNNLLSIGSK